MYLRLSYKKYLIISRKIRRDRYEKEKFKAKENRHGENDCPVIYYRCPAVSTLLDVYFSLKSNREIFGGNIVGLPENWEWANYAKVFEKAHLQISVQQYSCHRTYHSIHIDFISYGNLCYCAFKMEAE